MELSICIKMDLELNNQQRLKCRKTKPNKQAKLVVFFSFVFIVLFFICILVLILFINVF